MLDFLWHKSKLSVYHENRKVKYSLTDKTEVKHMHMNSNTISMHNRL